MSGLRGVYSRLLSTNALVINYVTTVPANRSKLSLMQINEAPSEFLHEFTKSLEVLTLKLSFFVCQTRTIKTSTNTYS